jgi:hypothetical protein
LGNNPKVDACHFFVACEPLFSTFRIQHTTNQSQSPFLTDKMSSTLRDSTGSVALDHFGRPIIEGKLYYIRSETQCVDWAGQSPPNLGGVQTFANFLSHKTTSRISSDCKLTIATPATLSSDDRRSLFWYLDSRDGYGSQNLLAGNQVGLRTYWGHYLSGHPEDSVQPPLIRNMGDSRALEHSLIPPPSFKRSTFDGPNSTGPVKVYAIVCWSSSIIVSSKECTFTQQMSQSCYFSFIPVEDPINQTFSQAARSLLRAPMFDYFGNLISYGKSYYIITGLDRLESTYNGTKCKNPALFVVNTNQPHLPPPSCVVKGNDATLDYNNTKDIRKAYWFLDNFKPYTQMNCGAPNVFLRNLAGGSLTFRSGDAISVEYTEFLGNHLQLNLSSGNGFQNLQPNSVTYSILNSDRTRKLRSACPYRHEAAAAPEDAENQFVFLPAEYINGLHIPRGLPSNASFQQYFAINQDWKLARQVAPRVPLFYMVPYFIKSANGPNAQYLRAAGSNVIASSSSTHFSPALLNQGITPGVSNWDYMFVLIPNGTVTDATNTSAESVFVVPLSKTYVLGRACLMNNPFGGNNQSMLIQNDGPIDAADAFNAMGRKFWISYATTQRNENCGVDTYKVFSAPYRYDGRRETALQMNCWKTSGTGDNLCLWYSSQAKDEQSSFHFIPAGVEMNMNGVSAACCLNARTQLEDRHPITFVNNTDDSFAPEGSMEMVESTLSLTNANANTNDLPQANALTMPFGVTIAVSVASANAATTISMVLHTDSHNMSSIQTVSVKNRPGRVPPRSVGILSLSRAKVDAKSLVQGAYVGSLSASGLLFKRNTTNTLGLSPLLGTVSLVESLPASLSYYISVLNNFTFSLEYPSAVVTRGDQISADGQTIRIQGDLLFKVSPTSALSLGDSSWEISPLSSEQVASFPNGTSAYVSSSASAPPSVAAASGSGISAARTLSSATGGS